MKIGICSRVISENSHKKIFVNESYLKFATRYKLIPIILPVDQNIEYLLDQCDCFLIPGGNDIDAKYYHQKNHKNNILVDPSVDKLDFEVLKYAINNQKPVLGICRGIQVINVFFYGDLIQDIEDKSHENLDSDIIELTNDSTFKEILDSSFLINSYHHQAIGKIGEGIKIEGVSRQIVELITLQKYKIIGCQFHLEKINEKISDLIMKIFFNYF